MNGTVIKSDDFSSTCPACDYLLRGLPSTGRCPECSFRYDPRQSLHYAARPLFGGLHIAIAPLVGTTSWLFVDPAAAVFVVPLAAVWVGSAALILVLSALGFRVGWW